MASVGGPEVLTNASTIIETICKANGCVYAQRREGYDQAKAPFDCRVLYDDHVVENFAAEGCQSAAIINPHELPHEFTTVFPGTMTREGFTKHDGKAPMSRDAHRINVSGFHFSA